MKRILILEPYLQGHHGIYLDWIVDAFVDAGHRVGLATQGDEMNHPIFPQIARKLTFVNEMSVVVPNSFGRSDQSIVSMAKTMFAFWRAFREAFDLAASQQGIDFVFLPYVDYCTYALAFRGSPFGPSRWGGITMRQSFHFPAMGIKAPTERLYAQKDLLFLKLLRTPSLTKLFSIDQSLVAYVKGKGGDPYNKLSYLADPVDSSVGGTPDRLRDELGIREGDFLLVSYGVCSERKAIASLLDGLAHPRCPTNVHILLAGLQTPEIANILHKEAATYLSNSGRLHCIDRFLQKSEENEVLESADAVWAGYIGHYQMSAAIVHAGTRGIPSIGCNVGLIGWLVERYQCGVVVDVSNPSAVAEAIRGIATDPSRCAELGRNGFEAFREHTITSSKAALLGSLTHE